MLPWPWRHAQYRPRSCWASLNGTSGWLANVVATTAWEPLALSALLRTHSTFANFHQDCGNPNAPLEAFRLAQLLSNGCAMLSELSDAEDQRLWSPVITGYQVGSTCPPATLTNPDQPGPTGTNPDHLQPSPASWNFP